MLLHTFQQLPGVRERTERKWWDRGILRWGDARGRCPSRADPAAFEEALGACELAWERGDAAWFGARLPAKERWRIHHDFHEHAAYLDIETTGASRGADAITCIAVATRGGVKTFAKDRDLGRFAEWIRDSPILVTFNGGGFDLPFLRDAFGASTFERHAHFDVCVALRRLARRGGLKLLERELGVPRDEAFSGVDGSLAVEFWRRHRGGDPRALPTLERYCAEDVLGLPALAALAVNGLLAETPFRGRVAPLEVPRRIPCNLPFSRELVGECLDARARFAAP